MKALVQIVRRPNCYVRVSPAVLYICTVVCVSKPRPDMLPACSAYVTIRYVVYLYVYTSVCPLRAASTTGVRTALRTDVCMIIIRTRFISAVVPSCDLRVIYYR